MFVKSSPLVFHASGGDASLLVIVASGVFYTRVFFKALRCG
jgi:hypothetical protein